MADVPTWMNEQFVQNIVDKSEELKNEISKLFDISVAPATTKGDNYASEMLRVTIDYADKKSNEKKKSIIIKLSPQKGIQKDLIKKMGHFNTEISMMSKTLTKMNNLISTSSRITGTAFYTQTEDPVFLALEDLAPLGFQMANQHSGLDMEHTLLAVRALAKFHAASVAVCENEPDQKSLYLIGLFSSGQPPEMGWFLNSIIRILADEVAKWPEAKQYAEKLARLSTRACELGIAAAERQDDEFNVINHGDYWINNMLFRYENTKPVDLMMVDFQQSYYLSPALDLLYFFNTSVSEEIYNDHKEDVLKEYHKTLLTTLINLGCKPKTPTIEELQQSMKKRAFLGVIASFTVLPLVLVDKTKVTDINERISEDGQITDHPGFQNEHFRRIMNTRLRLFDRDGLLD